MKEFNQNHQALTRLVTPPSVTSWIKLPLFGLSPELVDQLSNSSATNSRLVQVEKSASGMNLRFIGVS